MWCAAEKCSQTPVFVVHIFPVSRIANTFGVFLSQYADDTHLYVAVSQKAVNDAVTNLQNCRFDVHAWFSQNGLVISPEESEAGLLSTTQLLTDVNVACCVVTFTDTVKLLCDN